MVPRKQARAHHLHPTASCTLDSSCNACVVHTWPKETWSEAPLDHLICLGNRLDHSSETIYEILPTIIKRYDPPTSAENRRLDVLFVATSLLPLNKLFEQSLGFV